MNSEALAIANTLNELIFRARRLTHGYVVSVGRGKPCDPHTTLEEVHRVVRELELAICGVFSAIEYPRRDIRHWNERAKDFIASWDKKHPKEEYSALLFDEHDSEVEPGPCAVPETPSAPR